MNAENNKQPISYYDYFNEFHEEINKNRKAEPLNIGAFPQLRHTINTALSRGGLIVIGGAPSAGKTTLVMQMACNIAKNDRRDVLVLALEMGIDELLSRDISRITFEKYGEAGAFTAAQILNGYKYEQGRKVMFTPAEQDRIDEADKELQQTIAQYVYIHEMDGEIKPSTIYKAIMNFKGRSGKPPIVVLDYLQLVGGENPAQDVRRAASELTRTLKDVTRKLHIPIFALSSTSREYYERQASEGFAKESGGIEFSADVTAFIQYEAYYNSSYLSDEAKKREAEEQSKKPGRPIVIDIKKNRGGAKNVLIQYEYFSGFNHFREIGEYKIKPRTTNDPYHQERGGKQKK